MSTLRINNIEAQSVPASPTIDEKVKVTNSSGDILVNIDGKTSGITTIGINTTDGNIKFDANSNVLITGILTATTLAGNFTPDSLEIGSNIKLGNAGVITATSFVGSGANLTGLVSLANGANNRIITATGANALTGESNLTFDGNDLSVTGTAPAINLIDTDSDDYKIHNVQGVLKITDTTASADRFVINDNGTGYFVNNFQIGSTTSSPGATLHIKTSYPSLKVDSGGHASDAYVRIISGNAQNSRVDFGDSDDDDIGKIDYDHGDNSMRFTTSASERLRIDSSGNLMINRTSASKKFSIRESSTSSGVYFCQTVGGSSHLTNYAVGIGFDPEGYPARNKIAIVAEGVGAGYSKGKLHFLVNDAANSSEATLSDAAMTIYETGQVGINRDTTPLNGVKLMVQNPSNNVFYAYHEGTGNNYTFLCRNDRASGSTQATQIIFLGSGNTYVGDIRSTGSATSYNTSSDYRLKENVTTISDGITRLKTLKPSRFNFISNPSQTVDGFLAHEVTAVPEAISGTKDEVVTQAMIDNGDAPSDSKLNDPIYQQIDQAKLVPLLTAALQEAVAKIETLEAKVAALEGS